MSKGSIFDVLIIGVSMLVLAIGILVASTVMTNVNTTLIPLLDNPGATAALNSGAAAINTFNYGFVIIAIGLGIGSLIFAWMVPTHPIFIIVSIIMLMISIIVLPALSNAFQTIEAEPSMAAAATNFPLMNAMMGNLPLIGVVFGVLMIIVLYTRYQSPGVA